MKIVIMIQLDGINKMILNQILIEHLLTKTFIQILKMVSLNFLYETNKYTLFRNERLIEVFKFSLISKFKFFNYLNTSIK